MVKRVIGRPGETIELQNNAVLINGIAMSYEPLPSDQTEGLKEDLRQHAVFAEGDLSGTAHAGMGDDRDSSMDSRYYGFVDKKRIAGEAKRVVASFDIHQWLNPRFPRFGKALD